MSKGQASLIEHTLTIFLALIILISVSALIYSFYSTVSKSSIEASLREVCLQTADGIVKLYENARSSDYQPSNSSSILLGEINLNLPSHVSRKNYVVYLISPNPIWVNVNNLTMDGQNISGITETSAAKVVAKTTQEPFVTVEHEIPNIGIALQGETENDEDDELRYFRYNFNGTVYDKIVLGSYDILIDITSIS